MKETAICSIDNIEFCGDPPISFASKEAICEEGSLTVLFALLFFGISFAIVQLVYHAREDKEEVVGLFDKEDKKTGKFKSHSTLETVFVKPFVPTTLEGFIAGIFCVWFWLTIPIAFTRYYEHRWGQEHVALHGPLNLLSWAFGCKGFDTNILEYTKDLESPQRQLQKPKLKIFNIFRKTKQVMDLPTIDDQEEMEHYKQVDWIFTLHLTFGLLWLISGAFQIFMTKAGWSTNNDVRILSHRWFGRIVAMPSVIAHLCVSSWVGLRNPLNHPFVIQHIYYCTAIACFSMLAHGWKYAADARNEKDEAKRERLINLHRNRMGILYITSVGGSGAIRLTVWMQWLFGKFFSQKIRMRVSRPFCQEYASQLGLTERGFKGDSDPCWEPVFINLLMMGMLNTWLELLFQCMLKRDGKLEKIDEEAMKIKATAWMCSLVCFVVILGLESTTLYTEMINWVSWATIYILVGFGRFHEFHQLIANLLKQKGSRKRADDRTCDVQHKMTLHSIEDAADETDETATDATDFDYLHEKED